MGRTDLVGIFPIEASIRRLIDAILMEQTEEKAAQRGHHLMLETLAQSAMKLLSACLLRSATDLLGPHQSASSDAGDTAPRDITRISAATPGRQTGLPYDSRRSRASL